MPKTTNEAARAVTKATRLIPVDSWADPAVSSRGTVAAARGAITFDAGALKGAVKYTVLIDRAVVRDGISVDVLLKICLGPACTGAVASAAMGHARVPNQADAKARGIRYELLLVSMTRKWPGGW